MFKNSKTAISVTGIISITGIIAAIFTFFGIQGNYKVGIAVCVFVGFVILLVLLHAYVTSRIRAKYASLEEYLGGKSDQVEFLKCDFSSADRLRIFLENNINENSPLVKRRLKVEICIRGRGNTEADRYKENVDRLTQLFERFKIPYVIYFVDWDYFMPNGVIINNKDALIGFYSRPDGLTKNFSPKLLEVSRGLSDYQDFLYSLLNTTHETLKSRSSQQVEGGQ